MINPDELPVPPASAQPESVEESILEMLHMFDPTTALHELELLDEETPPAPAPPAGDEPPAEQ
ncbi:hypothetical protein GCM10022408_18550 [Hymenobacter fastidiosus]|uniref:Uncharacterized protein n=1 Tax=Hymenobacter fastidiosus TaxID=486264 RepID=A0ABP7S5S9_9BACT